MRAWATQRPDRPSKKRLHKRQRSTRTAPPPPPPPSPPWLPQSDLHFEAGWTDSWSHRRCLHQHATLLEAAECALPHGCGWYVFAVRNGFPRELFDDENEIIDRFRFKR